MSSAQEDSSPHISVARAAQGHMAQVAESVVLGLYPSTELFLVSGVLHCPEELEPSPSAVLMAELTT